MSYPSRLVILEEQVRTMAVNLANLQAVVTALVPLVSNATQEISALKATIASEAAADQAAQPAVDDLTTKVQAAVTALTGV